MPPARQCVRHSARLQVNARTCLKAMELPQPSTSSRRGKGQGHGADSHAHRTTAKIIIHWTRSQDLYHTDTLVQHLTTNSADVCILFYEGKKSAASNSSNKDHPSGKDKGEVYQFMVKLIFTKDEEYSAAYAEDPKKFDVAVGNCVAFLKKSFKEQLDKFNRTGAGVTLLDENGICCWPSAYSPPFFAAASPPSFTAPSPPTLQYPPPPPSQYSPPLLLPPLFCSTVPPPLQYPPSLLLRPGAGGGPIDDPDGDMEDDPRADDDDNNDSPFGTPLGNVLDTLDRDFEMRGEEEDDGLEVGSSWHCAISLNSPPKVAQMPMYHSHEAFGSASPGSHVPHKLPLPLGISCSCSSPSSTTSSSAYVSSDYWILPMTSQISLSTKPQSSVSSKKKRTLVVDMEGQISMLNDEIKSMHSDMSERWESKNECYALKMNYQSQKKEYQWHHESHSHEIISAAAMYQHEQEAKDKEILCLQVTAALQEKEAETWHLKIQYKTMMMCTAGGDVPGPSS
ncbi:hypothetical protein F4604DRAFT_1928023 [Suillus subluteus]|nr:hypothetical protein F4604DRAFT_1928023 [Suillus subluteus]